MVDQRSGYSILAESFTESLAIDLLAQLTETLALDLDADLVQIWRTRPGGLGVELSWPGGTRPTPILVPEVNQLLTAPEVDANALIQDGAMTKGVITITRRSRREFTGTEHRQLADIANCILLVWRREELRTTVDRQVRHTSRLAGELADADRQLSTVRELERRRVASEIITLSTARLGQLQRQVGYLGTYVAAGRIPADASFARLRDLLDTLIEDFRVMVRGIHPQVLRSRGPRAALAEVVAGLQRPARISGTVPTRVDQELGTALYYLTASALLTLTGAPTPDPRAPVEAHLSQAGGTLNVQLTGRVLMSAAALRAALTIDTDRIVALGGGVDLKIEDAFVTLRAWLPDQLEPAPQASSVAPSSLPARVRTLALNLAARYGNQPEATRVRHLITRLDGALRLGVDRSQLPSGRNAWLTGLERTLPDIQVVAAQPADLGNLADVVLAPSPAGPGERVDLLLPGSGALLRATPWADLSSVLTTELVSRADLLRTRSALAALAVLLRTLPATDPAGGRLHYELEELQAGTHELAELEALAELRSDIFDLPVSQLRNAEQLLGRYGTSASERLGLRGTATAREVIDAAAEQIEPWRRLAENATGRRQRQTCSVIVRLCERLLAEAIRAEPGSDRDSAHDRRASAR